MNETCHLDEEWRPFPEFEGRYEISNLGRVKSLPHSRRNTELIMVIQVNSAYPHRYVNLTFEGNDGKWKQKTVKVSRAVAQAFIPNPHNYKMVLHGPNGPADNSVSNLSWGSGFMNMADRNRDGTSNRGANNGIAKMTDEIVRQIKLLLKSNSTQTFVANKFGVARTTIAAIAQDRTWRHVTV